MAFIQSFKQDENQITFSKMLFKENALINLKQMTAQEIFNHYKAYKNFPKTIYYDQYFKQVMRIDNCELVEFKDVLTVGDNDEWVWTKKNKFLKCKNQTLLLVTILTNTKTGERVNLAGYQFLVDPLEIPE